MNKQTGYLIQDIAHSGVSLDIAHLKEAAFIEQMDLSGPKLILKFHDPDSLIRDGSGMQERDILTVELADAWHRDGVDKKIEFVINTMPTENGMLILNCLQFETELLKTPAEAAILFPKKPVKTIVSAFLPGVPQDIGSFPATEDYHLLPGGRPSRVLRQMARELGAMVFLNRGTLTFRALTEYYQAGGALEYEWNNRTADNQIEWYQDLNVGSVINDRTIRQYCGWNDTRGRVSGDWDGPAEIHGSQNESTLSNLAKCHVPVLDFVVGGNGFLTPGTRINITWNVNNFDAPIDEMLPETVVVGVVSHWYAAQKYYCRVKGFIPNANYS